MSKIIITRESKACLHSVQKLRDLGLDAHPLPLLAIEKVNAKLPQITPQTILVITSNNAMHVLENSSLLHKNSFIVVGQKTANSLSKLGITPIHIAKNSIDLLEYIKQTFHSLANFLYLSGDHISTDIPSALNLLHHTIERIIVYKSIIRDVSQELKVLEDADVLVFYSKRAAEAFATLNADVSKKDAIAISIQVASAIKHCGFQNIIVSHKPSEDSIIESLTSRYI